MKEERVEIVDFQKEMKRRERKEKIRNKINKVQNWANNNKEMILIFGPAALGLTTAGVKAVSRHMSQRTEKKLKENYCYDRSLGHYWKLRRELTKSEWVEIDKRKSNGERLADILDELKVLK